MRRRKTRNPGFTLIELMIVVAVLAVIAALAAPSLRDMVLVERLRGIHAQLATDLAFARSEAVARGVFVQVSFRSTAGAGALSCYTIAARRDSDAFTGVCDCTAPEGSRCAASGQTRELKTVTVPATRSVHMAPATGSTSIMTIDPRTGGGAVQLVDGVMAHPELTIDTALDSARTLRTEFGTAGRLVQCVPSGSTLRGPAC